jgi:hypothetical protein
MKHAKKYYDEDTIIKEIDQAKEQKEREAAHAEALDKEADRLFVWLNQFDKDNLRGLKKEQWLEKYQQAAGARTEADRLRKHQSAFIPKLERLKRTLAAFNTAPLAFAEKAVIAQ